METKRTKSVKVSDETYILLRRIQLAGLERGQKGTLSDWLDLVLDDKGQEFLREFEAGAQ